MFGDHRYDLDRTVRLVINCVLFAGAIFLISILRGVLLPFLVGCLIAYMFEPIVQFNRRLLHLRGRVVAVILTLVETLGVIAGICYVFIPMIISEATQMGEMLKVYATTEFKIPYIPHEIHTFLRRNLDLNFLASKLSHQEWTKMIEETLSASWQVITGSISFVLTIVSWMIVVLYVIFVMIDYDRIARGVRHMVPPKHRRAVFRLMHDVKVAMNHYFRGQALIAFIVGILFSIGFLIIGLPLAIVLGMFIGLLNMIPYLQLISLVPTTIICLVYSVGSHTGFWTIFGEAMAVYVIVQIIQDLILTPKIIGKAMSMNPALIFLSLSVWGTLMGMIGLLIAIPLTTLVLSYYDELVIRRPRPSRHERKEEENGEIEKT